MKKAISMIMACVLLFVAMTGCSTKNNPDKGNDIINSNNNNSNNNSKLTTDGTVATGRFVEEDMKLPEGVDNTEVVSLVNTPEGDIDLYVYNNGIYEKYTYADMKWNKEEVDALQKLSSNSTSDYEISNVFYGEDNKQYLLVIDIQSFHNALFCLSENGTYERVEVKKFDETYEDWDNMPCRPEWIKVLENGMIAAAYPWRVIEVYSPDGQSVVGEFNCGNSCVLAADGNILYYTDQNDEKLLEINMETMEEGVPGNIELDISDNGILDYDNGTAYLCDVSGIHLNQEGSSIWETLVDGSMSSLSTPSIILTQFIIGTANDYYLIIMDMEAHFTIKHVFYDENASSVPPVELSIFSIEDNKTIRQAITIFRKNHPEIQVNFRVANMGRVLQYTYGIKDPDEAVPLKDHINALNTELLAGKGADILVLDGLPMESYIEKGVLEDMGTIFTPMRDAGELLPNIIDPYFSDGKVYAIPIRFNLPVIYGSTDAVKSAETLKGLAEYARSSKEVPLLFPSDYRALAAWFLMIYDDQIVNQENEIDEESLMDFFDTIQILSDAIQASDSAELDNMYSSKGKIMGYWISSSIHVHKKSVQSNIEELGGIMDFAVPLEAAAQWQGSFRVLNNAYEARGLVGINSAGSQKELAIEFVQLLFSKEIQSLDLLDGFPVNQAALEEWIQLDKEGFHTGIADKGYHFEASYPPIGEREKIYDSICAVDKPMVNDTTMADMILDEAERYLRGDITADQAAKNAVSSINTYLSE